MRLTSLLTARLVTARRRHRALLLAGLIGLIAPINGVLAADTSPAQQLERFNAEAGTPGQANRGMSFFTSPHGGKWSCSSCHGKPPVAAGKHASTGKAIDPFAPAFNAKAFSSAAKVDKWFRRNCKDVLERECTPLEKADVLAYVLQIKP